MKLILAVFFACIALSVTTHAQVKRRAPLYSSPEHQPLAIVNSIETELGNFWLNPDKIKSVSVLKDSAAIAEYGDKGKNGVLIIETKPDLQFLKLTTLLDQYNIPESDKKLKICKDKVLVQNPDKIYADKSDIIKVEVITDVYWITPLMPGSEERFINIVTQIKP
jgi:TonB-dependent SusC/RagA subfamily outer membrane receptor